MKTRNPTVLRSVTWQETRLRSGRRYVKLVINVRGSLIVRDGEPRVANPATLIPPASLKELTS